MANQETTKRLGTAPVSKLLRDLAIPAVVAQLINLLYNIVDRIYIGHIPEIGSTALTGVGLFFPLLMLITAFANLIGVGGSPLTSIAMGQKDMRQAERILGACVTFLVILSLGLTVLLYLSAEPVLVFFGASEVSLKYALSYSKIYILGAIFPMMTLGLNPFITNQGFAKVSMMTIIIGAVLNIILDPILIFVFDMGVAGAAYATVFSQAVSTLWILIFLGGKQTTIRIKKENLRLDFNILKPCLALGSSSFIMTSTEALLSMTFNKSLASFGGDLAVGAMTVIHSLQSLLIMPLQGVTQGGQPIMSYNFGAGKNDRVKQVFRLMLTVNASYAFLFWFATLVLPGVLAGIFTSDPALLEQTVWSMRIYFACAFTLAFQLTCQMSFVALAQARISIVLACLRKIVLLIPLILILPRLMENKVFAVFVAEPVSDLIAAAITVACFLYQMPRILAAKKGA